MKKIYLNLLTVCTLNSIASLQAAIYLQNNYGATIEYVQTTPEMVHMQPSQYPAIKLGNGARTAVNNLPFLSIRSVGGNYSDISYIFKDIHILQTNHRGEDALIVIYPRQGLSGVYYWNVQIEWETPTAMPNFSKKTGDIKK